MGRIVGTHVETNNAGDPAVRVRLGEPLAAIGRDRDCVNLDLARDQMSAEPQTFE